MNNLFFVPVPLSSDGENSVWQVPSILGSTPKTFQKSAVKSALKYAKEVVLSATIKTENKVRYYPILMGQGRIIEGQRFSLSSPTRSRAGIPSNINVVRQVFNIREKLAPDKKYRMYVGEIVVDGEIVDVYTTPTSRPLTSVLPMSPNSYDWREGAFFRACDEMDAAYPAPRPATPAPKNRFGPYIAGSTATPMYNSAGRPLQVQPSSPRTVAQPDDLERRLRQIVIDSLEEAATPIDRNGT